jgi:hypothetical protein
MPNETSELPQDNENNGASKNYIEALWKKGLIANKAPDYADLLAGLDAMADKSRGLIAGEGAKYLSYLTELLKKSKFDESANAIANKVTSEINSTIEHLNPVPVICTQIEDLRGYIDGSVEQIGQMCENICNRIDERLTEMETQTLPMVEPNANAPRSYAEVTAFPVRPPQLHIDEPRARAQEEIRRRQLKFTVNDVPYSEHLKALSPKDLVETLNEALRVINAPNDAQFVAASWTAGSNVKLLTEMNTSLATDWLKNIENDTALHTKLEGAITINQRLLPVLVKQAPIHFDIGCDEERRRFEEDNGLSHGTLVRARWCKNPKRRHNKQQRAFLLLYMNDAKAANKIITHGARFAWERNRCTGEKPSREELRCYHCQFLGHITTGCQKKKSNDPNPTCAQCSGPHDVSACKSNQLKCVNCDSTDHASRDRNCPEFIRRCKLLNAKTPTNLLPYYPTEEEWTWSRLPINAPRGSNGSSPPPTQAGRQLTFEEMMSSQNTFDDDVN